MIDIDLLKRGDVVRLVSGGPYMTVRGFKPVGASAGHKPPSRSQVTIVVWSNRVGFIEKDFWPQELMFPPPRPASLPSDEAEADGV
ncbi:MAG: DUF2158 domain-containing protein [Caulobacteraceae bacterium]|nr:DUF2158 domain-containing protein [Caulobacteraceae bacterium]